MPFYCRINEKAMYSIITCLLLHITIGSIAIYYVKVSLYTIFFGLNCTLGALIFTSHTLGNPLVIYYRSVHAREKNCYILGAQIVAEIETSFFRLKNR